MSEYIHDSALTSDGSTYKNFQPPPVQPILSFLCASLPKCSCIRSWHPQQEILALPLLTVLNNIVIQICRLR